MPTQYLAPAIAAGFALVGLLPLAGRSVRHPLLWLCLIAGAGAGLVARQAVVIVGDAVAPLRALAVEPGASLFSLVVAAVVGEVLKALAPLAIIVSTPTDAPRGLGYGAAAGAGFGFVVAQQGVGLALGLVGSAFITPASTVIAIGGWFFRMLPQILTTAYVGRAGVVGWLGGTLFLAILLQVALGLADRLPLVGGMPAGVIVAAMVSVPLYGHLWSRRTSPAGPMADAR
jgi:hypothetical protein